MSTALMSASMLSSVKRLSLEMTADLVISTPFGDSYIPVRVLSHHVDSQHGLVAHVIPLAFPSPAGEGQGEGQSPTPEGEGSEEIKEIIVPFSTLINFRPTSPAPLDSENFGEAESGLVEGTEGIVRARL